METYTRLADVTNHETGEDVFSPPFSSEYEMRPQSTWSRARSHSRTSRTPVLLALLCCWQVTSSVRGAQRKSLSWLCVQAKLWWRVNVMGEPAEPVVPSGYLTLIPLNGAQRCWYYVAN